MVMTWGETSVTSTLLILGNDKRWIQAFQYTLLNVRTQTGIYTKDGAT